MNMFFDLFKKECKYYLKNPIYYFFIAVTVIFYIMQVAPKSINENYKPKQGDQRTYIAYTIKDERKIINIILEELQGIASRENVLKIGFVLNTSQSITEDEKQYVDNSIKDINKVFKEVNDKKISKENALNEVLLISEKVDAKLGGHTELASKNRYLLLNAKDSYKESMNAWNDILKKDHITNAVGRYFADCMGIVAGIFPIFLAAFFILREKTNQIYEIVYTKSISSLEYILSKFTALFFQIFIVFMILAAHCTIFYYFICRKNNYIYESSSFFKYTIFWICPTILICLSIGLFISTITEKRIIAVAIQLICWFISIMPSVGDYRVFKIFIRFNQLGGYDNYIKWLPSIIINRLFFVIISIFLIVMSIYIFDKKRGNVNGSFKQLL